MADDGYIRVPIPMDVIYQQYKHGKLSYQAYMLEKKRREKGKPAIMMKTNHLQANSFSYNR